MLSRIPLTPEQKELSEDSIENALVSLGIIYVDHLEEYESAITTLEKFIDKYSYSSRMPEALYYLYLAYKKTGNEAKAKAAHVELEQKFETTRYHQQVHSAITGNDDKVKKDVTRSYENIYNLFIEGNFTEALAQKKLLIVFMVQAIGRRNYYISNRFITCKQNKTRKRRKCLIV